VLGNRAQPSRPAIRASAHCWSRPRSGQRALRHGSVTWTGGTWPTRIRALGGIQAHRDQAQPALLRVDDRICAWSSARRSMFHAAGPAVGGPGPDPAGPVLGGRDRAGSGTAFTLINVGVQLRGRARCCTGAWRRRTGGRRPCSPGNIMTRLSRTGGMCRSCTATRTSIPGAARGPFPGGGLARLKPYPFEAGLRAPGGRRVGDTDGTAGGRQVSRRNATLRLLRLG